MPDREMSKEGHHGLGICFSAAFNAFIVSVVTSGMYGSGSVDNGMTVATWTIPDTSTLFGIFPSEASQEITFDCVVQCTIWKSVGDFYQLKLGRPKLLIKYLLEPLRFLLVSHHSSNPVACSQCLVGNVASQVAISAGNQNCLSLSNGQVGLLKVEHSGQIDKITSNNL